MDYRGQVIGRFGKSMTCPPDLKIFYNLGIKIHTIIFFFKIIVYLCSRKAEKTNEAARGNMLAWIENCV